MAVAQPKIESPSRNALLPVVAASLLMLGCSGNESAGPAISTTVDWGPGVPRPIPIAKNAPTHQQYVDKEMRWLTRLMLDTYEKQGTHGVAWDSKTEKAFASYCEAMASPSDRAGIESAVASCRAAREAGCRDPLLDYCLGPC